MKRALAALAVLLLLCFPARAEEDVNAVVEALDLSGFEEAAEGSGVDVRAMILSLAAGEGEWDLGDLLSRLSDAGVPAAAIGRVGPRGERLLRVKP